MNHTPTPYMIESDTDPITIIRQERGCGYGEVIAHCGSAKIPANHRHAAFIVRACNAHEALVAVATKISEFYAGTDAPIGILASEALKIAQGD
ncbi:hypothetical protein KGP36_08315 [Patescibacteria group bacterium]|nr:hypothetical protein [Patescibacteria group bacterium]